MKEKALATIYNRHYLGEDSFIFTCNYPTIGDYDEENGLFIDNSGNTYLPITSPYLMKKEIPVGFFNIITIDSVVKSIGENLTIEEAISNYEKKARSIFYYVGKIPSGEAFCIPLDTEKIKKDTEKVFDESVNEEDIIEKEDNFTKEEIEEIDNHYEYGQMHPQMMELLMNVINGEYSLEELKKLKKQLQSDFDDMAEVLSTIDLQEVAEEGEEVRLPASSKVENVGKKDGNRKIKTISEHYEDEVEKKGRIDSEQLFNDVTKTLIAQAEPTKRVIAEIARKELDDRKKRRGILLTGQTGVGKTELMRLIAKYINRPFIEIDTTQLTSAGWVGKDIEEYLWKVYESTGKDIEKTENAILYFDEIDKKGSQKRDDPSKKGVLDAFLKLLDGTEYDACEDTKNSKDKVTISTLKMIKIFGGAFTDVYKTFSKAQLGFGKEKEKEKYIPKTSDFVEKGMMTDEFMGRMDVIKLNDLDVESIKNIMLLSDQSALKIQEEIFKKLGVKITFTDSYVTAVAKQAYERKTGARGLDTVVDNTTWQAFAKVYTSIGEYEEVILDEKALENASNYQLIKAKKTNIKNG